MLILYKLYNICILILHFMFSLIPEEKIQDRIRFENYWWQKSTIPNDYAEMSRREYFPIFYEIVRERSVNRALILM